MRVQQPSSLSYFYSYIRYQILRTSSTTSPLGRIRRAANALCEIDGNTEYEAVLACINSLILLAMNTCPRLLLKEPKTHGVEECPDGDLKADIYVAAIYLGKTSYVESLIADGVEFCAVLGKPDVSSTIFGSALRAATIQGNVDMIKLLLSCIAEYRDAGILPAYRRREILKEASRHGHEATFDFALNTRPINPEDPDVVVLEGLIICPTPCRQIYERVAAILGPNNSAVSRAHRRPTSALQRSAFEANVEMVRYFLDKGASPNYTLRRGWSPLISAIKADDETLFRMLFDAGADPNLGSPPNSTLLNAVW